MALAACTPPPLAFPVDAAFSPLPTSPPPPPRGMEMRLPLLVAWMVARLSAWLALGRADCCCC